MTSKIKQKTATMASLVLATTLGMSLVACSQEHHTKISAVAESSANSYQARGVVRHVGDGSLQIRHESIPEFRGPDGEVVGMSAMTMDFALAEGVDVENLTPGDKIGFRLTIDLDADIPAWVDSVEVLPAETELEF